MQCCADVQATYRKQQTPQLWRGGCGGGGRGGVQIPLFFEVTQFEYNVSTILLPIVGWGKWYHFGFGCDSHNRQQNCWDFALKWGYFEE